MTFEPTDAEIADLLGDGPTPGHRADFWSEVEAGLGVAPVVLAERSDRRSAEDEITFDDTVVPMRAPDAGPQGDDDDREGPSVGRWLIAAAAAFVSTFLLNDAADEKSTIYAGDGSDDYSSRPAAVDDTGRQVISPLVEFSAAHDRDADTVMFTIESSMPLRTRSAVLDRYDGGVWTSEGDFRGVQDGAYLARDFADVRLETASFRGSAIIEVPDDSGLSLWRPLPYEAQTVTVLDGAGLSYGQRNVQLIGSIGDGAERYEVTYSPSPNRRGRSWPNRPRPCSRAANRQQSEPKSCLSTSAILPSTSTPRRVTVSKRPPEQWS